ncbi:hypothetical protein L1889_08220 [Paenalcaligenes niemegkensis]|nr:hypothetical protein [Paenalcaligenes niemegkensis]MCQ9616699.1 hypothetical protein [Paenalcaligenes niemegkensis]
MNQQNQDQKKTGGVGTNKPDDHKKEEHKNDPSKTANKPQNQDKR